MLIMYKKVCYYSYESLLQEAVMMTNTFIFIVQYWGKRPINKVFSVSLNSEGDHICLAIL